MLYLITGGSGFVGQALVKVLLENGHQVRIINSTPTTTTDDQNQANNLECVTASITDYPALRKAAIGVNGIFHLAGIVEHSRAHAHKLHAVNVLGTENVMRAASEIKCRVVFMSTSGTVAVSRSPTRVFGDDADYATDIIQNWPYYASKMRAEVVARDMARTAGVQLVILRPAAILGPGDPRLRAVSKVWKFMKRKHPYTPNGGIEFVDVRDVAQVCLQAMITPQAAGKSYLLGAVHMSIAQFFQHLEDLSGVPKPSLRLPFSVAWNAVKTVKYVAEAFNKHDTLDPVVVEMADMWWSVDSKRAVADLNFNPRPWQQTLKETVTWLQDHGDILEAKLAGRQEEERSRL